MKKINAKWLGSILCSLVMFSNLHAMQVDAETIKLINASSARNEEDLVPEEEEMARDLLDSHNEGNKDHLSKRDQPIMSIATADLDEGEEEVVNGLFNSVAAYYATTHRAAYHKAINRSADGLDIELEDKSIWQVHSWDASKVKSWQSHQIIVVAPNKNIFTKGSYPFKFVNLDTKQTVKVKMKLTPVLNDPNQDIYVHWIEDINYYNGIIRLEDGSVWNIKPSDISMMRHFARYNIVIVGTNDGWFRGSYSNILICVRNNAYICGTVIN